MRILFLVVLGGLSALTTAQAQDVNPAAPKTQEHTASTAAPRSLQETARPEERSASATKPRNELPPAPAATPKPKAKPAAKPAAKPSAQANLGSAARRALLEKRGATRGKPAGKT